MKFNTERTTNTTTTTTTFTTTSFSYIQLFMAPDRVDSDSEFDDEPPSLVDTDSESDTCDEPVVRVIPPCVPPFEVSN